MVDYRNIIVLQDGGAFRDDLVRELTRYEFAVRRCHSLLGFDQLYTSCPASVVVLLGTPDTLFTYTRQIREKTTLATIVVLGSDANMGWRERIEAAGANACYDMFTDASELAEILAALGRYAALSMRMEIRTTAAIDVATEVATSASWQLIANGRMLRSPYGRTLPLTWLESRLLRYAAVSDRHLLRRKRERPRNDARCSTPELPHLDRLVSRLRRKAQSEGIELPLIAVRWGYLFAERLDMPASEALS